MTAVEQVILVLSPRAAQLVKAKLVGQPDKLMTAVRDEITSQLERDATPLTHEQRDKALDGLPDRILAVDVIASQMAKAGAKAVKG